MCLGIPGRIKEIHQNGSLLMAKLDLGGVIKEVCLAYTPEAKVGDYALIHVGFAISLMDEDEALETLKIIREVADFEQELGSSTPSA